AARRVRRSLATDAERCAVPRAVRRAAGPVPPGLLPASRALLRRATADTYRSDDLGTARGQAAVDERAPTRDPQIAAPERGIGRELEFQFGLRRQLTSKQRRVLRAQVQRHVAHARCEHGQTVVNRGLQHDRIALDLAPHEVAGELYGQRHDLVLNRLLE